MLTSEWLLSRVTMLAIHCFSRLVGVFERLEGFSQVNHRIRMFIELQSLRLSEKRVCGSKYTPSRFVDLIDMRRGCITLIEFHDELFH